MKWALSIFALILCRTISGQECAADGSCDLHERCPAWKADGECVRNKDYMKKHCPVSCASERLESAQEECADLHPRCSVWADLGECDGNDDMKKYCAKSCDSCHLVSGGDDLCTDNHENCGFWADSGECNNNPKYMHSNCAKSCGTCKRSTTANPSGIGANANSILDASGEFGERQRAEGGDAQATLKIVEASVEYMASTQFTELPIDIKENCRNKNDLCSYWAHIGECEANQGYMKVNCAPACRTCHLIDMSARCPPRPDDAEPGLRPGDLNKMFERIVAIAPGNRTLDDTERSALTKDNMTEFTVKILSRPSEEPATTIDVVNDKSLPPWVITFDDFVTPEECEEMIALGGTTGYKRSEDVGNQQFDGSYDGKKSQGRTSENAWCSHREGCRDKEVPARLHSRISKVLGIPPENSEDFQMLRYEIGQFYNTHHDYIPHQRDRQCGPRILTFFIYMSDVEEGGGTDFPDLGITVMPKRGRALLWPSVYDSDPTAIDHRMRHQALPVIAGKKYASNGWIHLYDYVAPQSRGCN